MTYPSIKTTQSIVPMLYAYSTPEVARHQGWVKIGYTEQVVEERIKQQTHTADIRWQLEWKGNAIYDDGSGERFTDKDFHTYLRRKGVQQEEGKSNEWFHIDGQTSQELFHRFRANRGVRRGARKVIPYQLREEQEEAVQTTLNYVQRAQGKEFLWNAKPRFGKTLAVYDFIKRLGAKKVLIVTNRPAIANSWFDDYEQFMGEESGYWFVSEVEALRYRHGVINRADYIDLSSRTDTKNCIEFVSLQDLKGSRYFGGHLDKLSEVHVLKWDVLVIDEAHEGVDTYRTDVAFEQIKRQFTLHLSGTPFKALARAKFRDEAIYHWTYADEQKRKLTWDSSQTEENPYVALPQLNLYTYQMSEIIKDELRQGIEIEGETEEYAFDLNEFFATDGQGRMRHSGSVDKFLDAMTTQTKYPFSTEELRDELKHTLWLLDRVDSAKALANKLKNHPIFSRYEIILAAGDGKLDDQEATQKSYDKVVATIAKHARTITLSVGQLTIGVTIPEWSAVLMLSNVKSPALYMQAAFRAQNPHVFREGSTYKRKQNAYVFDFDPVRTLGIVEEFANDLSPSTVAGNGDLEQRKQNIRELLNFFPVIGEDEQGELIELDAEQILSIPRKIRSVEVVRRGFMSNFLFQNIGNIFGAPKEVLDIINSFQPISEPKKAAPITLEQTTGLQLDEQGHVALNPTDINTLTEDIFGPKIYQLAPDTTHPYTRRYSPLGHAKVQGTRTQHNGAKHHAYAGTCLW